jgi:hypothetical protein
MINLRIRKRVQARSEKQKLIRTSMRTNTVATKIELLQFAKQLQKIQDCHFIVGQIDAKYIAVLEVDQLSKEMQREMQFSDTEIDGTVQEYK